MVANAEVQPRKLDPDFAGLLQAKDVALAAQEALAQLKILSISRFAAVADTRAELRTFCESSLKPIAAAAVDVVGVASLVDAWECARVRIETRHKAEAEAVISGLPKTVARTELGQLREILESTFHEIPEKCAPAATTLERHFDMIDHGEWQQLSLQDYASREDAAQELVGATIDRSTGTNQGKERPYAGAVAEKCRRIAFTTACSGTLLHYVFAALSTLGSFERHLSCPFLRLCRFSVRRTGFGFACPRCQKRCDRLAAI